jgi:head-tail adaptor
MSRIGSLRQQVTLLQPVETPDGVGGLSRVFVPAETVNAALETLRGAEDSFDERKSQRLIFRLTMRWRGDIGGGWRVALGARSFEVLTAADPDGRGRFLICEIEEARP